VTSSIDYQTEESQLRVRSLTTSLVERSSLAHAGHGYAPVRVLIRVLKESVEAGREPLHVFAIAVTSALWTDTPVVPWAILFRVRTRFPRLSLTDASLARCQLIAFDGLFMPRKANNSSIRSGHGLWNPARRGVALRLGFNACRASRIASSM
jgi:hypothetical protein